MHEAVNGVHFQGREPGRLHRKYVKHSTLREIWQSSKRKTKKKSSAFWSCSSFTALRLPTLKKQRDLALKHPKQRGVQINALQSFQQALLLLAGLLLGVETVGHQPLLTHTWMQQRQVSLYVLHPGRKWGLEKNGIKTVKWKSWQTLRWNRPFYGEVVVFFVLFFWGEEAQNPTQLLCHDKYLKSPHFFKTRANKKEEQRQRRKQKGEERNEKTEKERDKEERKRS